MPRLDIFRKQHEELMAFLKRMAPMLKPDQLARDSKPVSDLLTQLISKLMVHLAMEDRSLYPRLVVHQDRPTRETAKRFMAEMGSVAQTFGAYSKKWMTAEAIRLDPITFVTETRQLFEVLGKRIEQENTLLYPLAERAD
jgi:hypothetical protein